MSDKHLVLVTGANGFIGSALLAALEAQDYPCRAVARQPMHNGFKIANIDADTDWSRALSGCSHVVHLAARVHVMRDQAVDPLAAFRDTNVAGTLNLARRAAEAGVRRFVFISSIKVNGEATPFGAKFRADDMPAPEDPYGISKYEAEQGLFEIAQLTGMEVVCIRPPIVYGPGVKGNFQSMLRWVDSGIPLPLGTINNQRSLIGLDNLVSLIIACLHHPGARNQVFLASDGEDLSTTDLLRRVAHAVGKSPRLLPVPVGVLKSSAAILGKHTLAQRLLGSLRVDIGKTIDLIGWRPVASIDDGLRRTVEYWRLHQLQSRRHQ